jgi:RND family efflux transporter MFP subunit
MLRENDATSAERYDEAETAYTAAVANLEAAKARKEKLLVQQSRREVTAPIDGTVLTLYRENGDYVASGTPLALVGDFGLLTFTIPLEDMYAHRLALGDEARLLFRNKDLQKVYGTEYAAGNMGTNQEFIARLTEITPSLSEPAAMRSVTWQIDNSAKVLEPQTYGGVSLTALKGYSVLAVPLAAMTDNSRSAVFVLAADGTVSRRSVETGANDGEYISILSGLSEGEIVVTNGMEGLMEGMKAEIELSETNGGGAVR